MWYVFASWYFCGSLTTSYPTTWLAGACRASNVLHAVFSPTMSTNEHILLFDHFHSSQLILAIGSDSFTVPTQFVQITSIGAGLRVRSVCTACNNLPVFVITCITQWSYACLSFYPSLESTGWKDIFKNFIDQVNSIILFNCLLSEWIKDSKCRCIAIQVFW